MVKEDSFGLFGRVEGEGRMLEEGGERRRAGGGRRGAGGGRGIASLSERNNVERAKEGDSHRERVRVFGQQPPGVWSLSNTRDIPAWGWMGYGSLDFRGYVL